MPGASLMQRFADHLDGAGLLTGPGVALLAVSGGPDSLALLDLVAGVAAGRGLAPLVVHVDHGIHPDSARIAARVTDVARDRYSIETTTIALGLAAGASETEARAGRYEAFRGVQAARDARWLVTAHHADDQAETVLLRLLRGSGPAGLAGIAPKGPGGLVRPLLPFRHQELVDHVAALDIEVFDDPANADARHTRSWIRHAVLPVLRERLGDDADRALLGVARHSAADVVAWDAALDLLPGLELRVAEGRFDVARTALRGYDSLLAGRVIRAAAHRTGFMLGPAQAARVVAFAAGAASGRSLDLGEGVVAEASFDRLILRRAVGRTGGRADGWTGGRSGGLAVGRSDMAQVIEGDTGSSQFAGFDLRWRRELAPENVPREGWTTWIAPGALQVALPEPGARIVPLGGNGHRAVSKLMMEERVPRGDRAGWPIVIRDDVPVWIPGICRADAAIPEPGSLAVRMDASAC